MLWGVWIGVAGNQTARAGSILRKLNLPADLIATSDELNTAKPDAAFFQALLGVVPWGYILEHHPDLPAAADWRITSLAELPEIVSLANALTVVLKQYRLKRHRLKRYRLCQAGDRPQKP